MCIYSSNICLKSIRQVCQTQTRWDEGWQVRGPVRQKLSKGCAPQPPLFSGRWCQGAPREVEPTDVSENSKIETCLDLTSRLSQYPFLHPIIYDMISISGGPLLLISVSRRAFSPPTFWDWYTSNTTIARGGIHTMQSNVEEEAETLCCEYLTWDEQKRARESSNATADGTKHARLPTLTTPAPSGGAGGELILGTRLDPGGSCQLYRYIGIDILHNGGLCRQRWERRREEEERGGDELVFDTRPPQSHGALSPVTNSWSLCLFRSSPTSCHLEHHSGMLQGLMTHAWQKVACIHSFRPPAVINSYNFPALNTTQISTILSAPASEEKRNHIFSDRRTQVDS